MKWTPTGSYSSVTDAIITKSGFTEEDLLHPKKVSPHSLHNLEQVARMLDDAVHNVTPITIVGDYDADGITATAILSRLLNYLGANPTTVIPKRMTDGYGITIEMIQNTEVGLFITVDNGISCVDEIALARQLGNQVIILDHHMPGEILPSADVIVDPHIHPEDNGYEHYCGAGLAYKLAELMLEGDLTADSKKLLAELNVLACIGTIADIVPITGDNRRIVMDGLDIIRNRLEELPVGLKTLIRSTDDNVNEETIAFKLGPLINAPGRLYNAGGTSVLKALLCDDLTLSMEYVSKLNDINNARKAAVLDAYSTIERIIKAQELDSHTPICVFSESAPEGLIGILSAKILERYNKPAFVFSRSNSTGLFKGSGRSVDGFDMTGLLRYIAPLTVKAGGHSAAAGITLEEKNYPSLVQMMDSYSEQINYRSIETPVAYYDLEITPQQVTGAMEELKRFAPFGAGIPKPVFAIRGFEAVYNWGSHYRLMGSSNEHLKLNGGDFSAVAFGKAGEYLAMNCPQKLDLLGTIGENSYKGRTTLQFQVADLALAAN